MITHENPLMFSIEAFFHLKATYKNFYDKCFCSENSKNKNVDLYLNKINMILKVCYDERKYSCALILIDFFTSCSNGSFKNKTLFHDEKALNEFGKIKDRICQALFKYFDGVSEGKNSKNYLPLISSKKYHFFYECLDKYVATYQKKIIILRSISSKLSGLNIINLDKCIQVSFTSSLNYLDDKIKFFEDQIFIKNKVEEYFLGKIKNIVVSEEFSNIFQEDLDKDKRFKNLTLDDAKAEKYTKLCVDKVFNENFISKIYPKNVQINLFQDENKKNNKKTDRIDVLKPKDSVSLKNSAFFPRSNSGSKLLLAFKRVLKLSM